MRLYAQIVINLDAPLESSFHYHLPADLQGTVEPGHLVEVEFGPRLAQGIVIGLDTESPVPETKPVIALVLPDPVLSSVQIELAQWLSQTYLAPLIDCLRLMLPPGLSRSADLTLELIPHAAEGARLSDLQGKLVELLQERGDLRGRQINRLLPKVEWRPAAAQLVRRGILRRGSVLDAPRARPKQIRTAQLVAGPQQVAAVLPTLGRRSKSAEVLEYLLASPDPLPGVKMVRQATGCTPKHLQALVEAEHIVLTPGRTLVALVTAPAEKAPYQEAGSEILAQLESNPVPLVRSDDRLLDPLTGSSIPFDLAELEALEREGARPPDSRTCHALVGDCPQAGPGRGGRLSPR